MHELGGHPLVLRSDELQLVARRGAARHRARALPARRRRRACGPGRTRCSRSWRATARCRSSTCSALATTPARRSPTCSRCARRYGTLEGLRVAYVGDGNNVARSLAVLGALAGLHVAIASPEGYALERDPSWRRRRRLGQRCTPIRARPCADACAVYTDVWVSMGDEATAGERRAALGALPDRRRAARPRRAGRVRDARPARAPRRGDHRRGPLRLPPAHLGPGGEPPPRAEGAARAAGRRG